MATRLSAKLTLDSSQHDNALKDAVKEVSKYKREVDSANKQLNQFSKATSTAGSSISSMMNAFRTGDFMGFANSARAAATAIGSLAPAAGGASAAVTGLQTAITTALGPIGLIVAAIGASVAIAGASIKKNEEFKESIRGLSALTGVTGSALDQMGQAAIGLSMKFGTAAKDIVDSMKLIGSQAPQLLTDMEGLKKVTENAMVLEKASDGMTVQDTAKAITTVMNQMDVAASESDKIINSLAAGAQKGAADVLYLTTAIEKTGTQAKNAGMSYQDLVGAIETLAPKFSSADVAGTSLNALLVKLTTQTNSNFNPAIVGLDKALENLEAANLSAADKLNMFGRAGLVAADTLIKGRKSLQDMTDAVTGTNTAYEQMETKQGGLAKLTDKLKASWDALMITYGESPQIQACVALIGLLIKGITLLIQGITKMVQIWNNVWNEVGQVLAAVWNNFIKPYWDGIVKTVTDSAVYKAVVKIWTAIVDFVRKAIEKISKWWRDFKEMLGIKTEVNIPVKTEVDKKSLDDLQQVGIDLKKQGGKTAKTSVKVEYETGSLDDYKARLQKLQKMLTSKNMSLVDVEKTKQKIRDLEDFIEKREIELGIKAKEGSLDNINNQISAIDERIRKLNPSIDMLEIDNLMVKKEALEKLRQDTQAAIDGASITRKKFESKGSEGTLQYAQDKVSWYKQMIQLEIEGSENWDYLCKQLKEWTKKENIIRMKVEEDTSSLEKSSLKYLQDKVAYFKAQLNVYAYESPEYLKALEQLQHYVNMENNIKVNIDIDSSGAKEGSLDAVEKRISDLNARIKLEVYGSPEYIKLSKELKELTKQEQVIKAKIDIENMDAMERYMNITDVFGGIDSVVSSFKSLSDAIEQDASAWDIFMGVVDSSINIFRTVEEAIEAINIIQQILAKTSLETAAVQETTAAQAVTNSAKEAAAASTTIAAKSGEAIASATASGAKLAFPANLVAIAAGVAAVIAALAMITKFAGGGIIQGRTTVGDYNLARVNGGEMILNNRQQSNLFRAIDHNNLGGNSGPLTGTVVKIQGSDLYLMFSNLAKEKAKIGKNIYR